MDRRRTITFLLAALVTILTGMFAAAPGVHAGTNNDEIVLAETVPRNGAVLNATPNTIVIRFEERLPNIDPIVQVQNENGAPQNNLTQPILIDNRTAIRVRLTRPLPAGEYTVTFLLRPEAGEEVADNKFSFTLVAAQTPPEDTAVVNDGTTAPPPSTSGLKLDKSSNYTGGLGTLGRFLGFFGLAAVAGGLLLIAVAWAEGVEYVLTVKHLWMSWGIGVIGCMLTVATAASDKTGNSIARSLVPTEWADLLDTATGKALVIRLAAMIGCVWVAARPERVVDHGTKWMALAVPTIGLVTYGWSRDYGDHVAAVPAGILHAVAGAAWLGGAFMLVRVVLAGPGEEDLVGAVRRFRGIYLLSVVGVVVSGVIQTSIFLGGASNLTTTRYGKIYLLKIVAVAAMAFVATGNRGFARQRLRSRHLDAKVAERLHRSTRTEVLAGAAVVLLAAWMLGTAAPGTSTLSLAAQNRDVYTSEDGTFSAEVTFGPKQVNSFVEFHFKLRSPDAIDDGVVTLTPDDGKSYGIEIPIAGSPNYGFGPDQGFKFGSSGKWTITINGDGPDGPLQEVTGSFVVKNQDGSTPTPTSSTTTTSTTEPETDDSSTDDSSPDTTD